MQVECTSLTEHLPVLLYIGLYWCDIKCVSGGILATTKVLLTVFFIFIYLLSLWTGCYIWDALDWGFSVPPMSY